jgi:two-component system sensor histidine kinase HydH
MRRFGPVVVAIAVSAVLMAAALVLRSTVDEAARQAATGLGETFAAAGLERWRGQPGGPPTPERLADFLADHQAAGLRHVALVGPDGRLLASAGTPGIGRARASRPLPPPRPPPHGRPPPRLPQLIYEYEPLVADRLRDRARTVLIVASAASALVLGLSVVASRGMAQRERMRAELDERRRLAALGEMSAVLAHELRNPIASLKGNAQLLLEDHPEHARIARVVGEAERLEQLTGELLDFVGGAALDRQPADLAALVRAAVDEVGAERFTVAGVERPVPARIDAGRLGRALVNVLRNAAQAAPDRPAEVTLEVEPRRATIVVRDRGPGIAAGDQRRIFEPFQTRKVRGVGLGLAITQRIVEQHGGAITADNHPDGGARFRIAIPREVG